MSDDTRGRIENGLRNLADVGSEERQRFEAAQHKWDQILQPLENAIVASERLSAEDFAIRINARD